jgi:hypothetical protein
LAKRSAPPATTAAEPKIGHNSVNAIDREEKERRPKEEAQRVADPRGRRRPRW